MNSRFRLPRTLFAPVLNRSHFRRQRHSRDRNTPMFFELKLGLGLAAGFIFQALVVGQEAPSISYQKSTFEIGESDGNAVVTVIRSGDTSQSITVEYNTADVTAIAGEDYQSVTGTLSFDIGEEAKQFEVPILNDGLKERLETIEVQLLNPTGGASLGSRPEANLRIISNDEGFRFSFPSTDVSESQESAEVRVWRGDDLEQPASVTVRTVDGTALSGIDFESVEETLEFGPTEEYRVVSIPLLNDSLIEGEERFSIELTAPSEGVSLGQEDSITCAILDNDLGFGFANEIQGVYEDAGEAVVTVVRRWDNLEFISTLEFATESGSAVPGEDFEAVSGQLTFSAGETRKEIRIPIQNDGLAERDEFFRLQLISPGSETPLAGRSRATVNIFDNDPGVKFQFSRYEVRETDGTISIVIERGNDGDLGAFTLNYETEASSATADEDFVSVSGTLEFGENETVKAVEVTLLEDENQERTERFWLSLRRPNEEEALIRAAVTIDDAAAGSFRSLAPSYDPGLQIRQERDLLVIQWDDNGILQRADKPEGPWANVPESESPHRVKPVTAVSFYRVSHPRPTLIYVPSSYDPNEPMPLVFALHGFGNTGQGVEDYWNWLPQAEERGFLYCYPDGSPNSNGDQFWNASDACCNLDQSDVDDVTYLRGLVEAANNQYHVDPQRIYFAGISNGGYMAHRMACEYSEVVAAIASQAGAAFFETDSCNATHPISVLQIHGTSDTVVRYDGDLSHLNIGLPYGPYPSANRTVQNWAIINECENVESNAQQALDLTRDVRGLDTRTTTYSQCAGEAVVELWSMERGTHVPSISNDFSNLVLDWLFAHPKMN